MIAIETELHLYKKIKKIKKKSTKWRKRHAGNTTDLEMSVAASW